jgi:RNA-binding protein YlmH
MIDRDKILRYYRSTGDHELAARIISTAEATVKNRRFQLTEFLDPHGYAIAESAAAYEDSLELRPAGGYAGAERAKAVFINREFTGDVELGVEAIGVEWDARYYQLSHRDVLGGLLALGIKRGLIGDINMLAGSCQIIVDASITTLLINELLRIGAANVKVKTIELSALQQKAETVKEIRSTVASLRLDSVAAAGFGMSRTQMAEEIQSEKVKVNWKDSKNGSQMVKAGDVISFRGRGRIEVVEITGQTKKGRTGILLKRYL